MNGHELLIGVTGGIAAYKTAAMVSRLVQAGAGVTVVMTDAAARFVGPTTFEALTGRTVCTSLFDHPEYPLGGHVSLADKAVLMCVAPATANFLAKAAQGIADDLLSTLYLAFPGPVVVAPAMNTVMWNQPAVQRNVQQLRRTGCISSTRKKDGSAAGPAVPDAWPIPSGSLMRSLAGCRRSDGHRHGTHDDHLRTDSPVPGSGALPDQRVERTDGPQPGPGRAWTWVIKW
jgi:phosphopantothenoylcysteine decarboxylase